MKSHESLATKQSLADALINEMGLNAKDAKNAVNIIFNIISNELIDKNTVEIHGFGKFKTEKVQKRSGVNPATGERITISARIKPKFIPSKILKDSIDPSHWSSVEHKVNKKTTKVKTFSKKMHKKYAVVLSETVGVDIYGLDHQKLTHLERSRIDGSKIIIEPNSELQKRAHESRALLGDRYVELGDIKLKHLTKRELLELIWRMSKKMG